MRLSRRARLSLLAGAYFTLAVVVVLNALPPALAFRTRAVALYVRGRTGQCTLTRSLAAEDYVGRLQETASLLQKRIKLLRTENGMELLSTPHGTFWVPPPNPFAGLLAEQEEKIYGEGEFEVRPGDIVLDCGANVGTYTRLALGKGAALVVAIEPEPKNLECLRRNFAAEIAAGRVRVYEKGVWHREEMLSFWVYKHSALDSFVMNNRKEEAEKPRKIELPVTTIDKLVSELRLARVDFIKMDVEGAERNALEGALGTIAKYRPRMAIATENLADDQHVVPRVIRRARPDYRQACGPCRPIGTGEIRADVLYFY